jgi:predicted glycosyltransferase involved in capsule biosynthesis
MSEDLPTNHVATTNYELFCDVETMMRLTCVLPMLEAVQSLNKLAQNINYFIFYFVVVVKLT